MRSILLFLSSRNISLKLIPADELDLTTSLHLKYIKSWKISPSPAIMPAVMRYSVLPTAPPLPVSIQTKLTNTPGAASAMDLSVLPSPAALLTSSLLFEMSESMPCDGISAIVMLMFQSTTTKIMYTYLPAVLVKGINTKEIIVRIASGNAEKSIHGRILPALKLALSMRLPMMKSAMMEINFAARMMPATAIKSA